MGALGSAQAGVPEGSECVMEYLEYSNCYVYLSLPFLSHVDGFEGRMHPADLSHIRHQSQQEVRPFLKHFVTCSIQSAVGIFECGLKDVLESVYRMRTSFVF